MNRHIVLVGAGHAHLSLLVHLEKFIAAGHRVTVVSRDDFQYYSGMGPGMLAGTYRPREIRFHVRKMVEDRGARFLRATVTAVEAVERRLRTADGQGIDYDLASFNTGSFIPFDVPSQAADTVFTVKPIERLLAARRRMMAAMAGGRLSLVVAGGGPTGVEIAANLRRMVEDAGGSADILLVAGERLMARFDPKVGGVVRSALARRGVRVLEGVRLLDIGGGGARLSDGRRLEADYGLLAVGTRPSPLFRVSGLAAGEDGGLPVNACLQCPAHPEIFGGGDCIRFQPRPLPKIGVYAVRQNPVLLHNLLAAAGGGPLRTFTPQKRAMLILNMGDGTGIFFRGKLVRRGRWAYWLKDAIDRRFMRRFQVSGEREEAD